MDFSLGSGETKWRDRVRVFIDQNVRPRTSDYDAQQREGERWKVLPVVEELKEKAKQAGDLMDSNPPVRVEQLSARQLSILTPPTRL